jgi:hypothetical protein
MRLSYRMVPEVYQRFWAAMGPGFVAVLQDELS